MEATQLDRLMEEVPPFDDHILVLLKTRDGAFAIRFEHTDVMAEWDETRKRLVLSVEIGTPPRARAAKIYETLLGYNLLWSSTGGVHMALTGPGGAVVQAVDLAAAEIEARQIALVAANLDSLAGIWRAYFDSEDGGDGDLPNEPPSFSSADMIRA